MAESPGGGDVAEENHLHTDADVNERQLLSGRARANVQLSKPCKRMQLTAYQFAGDAGKRPANELHHPPN